MSLRRALKNTSLINTLINWSSPRNINLCLYRCFITCNPLQCEETEETPTQPVVRKLAEEGAKNHKVIEIDPIESMKYMESEAYREMYGDDPVWKNYRRNVKGHFTTRPRKQCTRAGAIATGSACPICRDDYLVFDYRNLKLLHQFIDMITGEPIKPLQTGLCMKQHKRLMLEVWKAQDYGYLQRHFPFRLYNYDYYHDLRDEKLLQIIEDPSEREKIEQSRSSRRTEYLKKQLIKYE